MVGIDIMTPASAKPTKMGNVHIFTATDYYTKWIEAFAIPNKTAKTVVGCLLEMFYRHGASSFILTDQGREFVNQVIAVFTYYC